MTTFQPQINQAIQVQPLAWQPIHRDPIDETFAAGVQRFAWHHWRAIDYHLYLVAIEKNRDYVSRTTKNQLLTAHGFQQISLQELTCPSAAFHQVPVWSTPVLNFVSLPVLHAHCKPSQRKLVLGFDFKQRCLIGTFFESAPDHLAELGEVWDEGERVINLGVERFLTILKYSIENEMQVFGRGLFRHFHEIKRQFSVGLELVVVIQFLQLLDDFAGLLWDDGTEFRGWYKQHEERLRDSLSQTSVSAWFALRDGLTIEQFCHRHRHDGVRSGVFLDQIEAPPSALSQSGAHSLAALYRLMEVRKQVVSSSPVQQGLDFLTVIGMVHFFAMLGRLLRFGD